MNNSGFNQFSLRPEIIEVTEKLGFREPTKIQKQAIPAILGGKSLIGQSHTGSGKTHAFLLPLLNNIQVDKREVQLVITSPTRELADRKSVV